jgi:hypothetical protein
MEPEQVEEVERLHNLTLDKMRFLMEEHGLREKDVISSDQFGLHYNPADDYTWARRGQVAVGNGRGGHDEEEDDDDEEGDDDDEEESASEDDDDALAHGERPPMQIGVRVRLAPGALRHADENWPGLTSTTTKGIVASDVHGIVRLEGGRGLWLVQWFGGGVERKLYSCQTNRIYTLRKNEWSRNVESHYTPILHHV